MRRKLIIHANPHQRDHIDRGNHLFANRVSSGFKELGIATQTASLRAPWGIPARFDQNYRLFHITGAEGTNLNYHMVYFSPFWSFERPDNRYTPHIAQKEFNPAVVPPHAAHRFFERLTARLLPEKPNDIGLSDFVLFPLQGKLTIRRPWQFATVAQIVDRVLAHEPSRQLVLRPHPKEVYSRSERSLIADLASHPRVLVS